jgi:hypothetical protein
LGITFYSVTGNTVATIILFEILYNLITKWARPYKGIGSKNSYSLGVSDELDRMGVKEPMLNSVIVGSSWAFFLPDLFANFPNPFCDSQSRGLEVGCFKPKYLVNLAQLSLKF